MNERAHDVAHDEILAAAELLQEFEEVSQQIQKLTERANKAMAQIGGMLNVAHRLGCSSRAFIFECLKGTLTETNATRLADRLAELSLREETNGQ